MSDEKYGILPVLINEEKQNIPCFAIDKKNKWSVLVVLIDDKLKTEMKRSEIIKV